MDRSLDALIKQIRSQKQEQTSRLASALQLIAARLNTHHEAIYGDVFKQAISDLYHAANQLTEIRGILKRDGYVTKSEMGKCIERSDLETFLWCLASAAAAALGVLLAVHYG